MQKHFNKNPKINLVIRVCSFNILSIQFILEGALSGPSQFLATESSLKMTKNAFHFTSKDRPQDI